MRKKALLIAVLAVMLIVCGNQKAATYASGVQGESMTGICALACSQPVCAHLDTENETFSATAE